MGWTPAIELNESGGRCRLSLAGLARGEGETCATACSGSPSDAPPARRPAAVSMKPVGQVSIVPGRVSDQITHTLSPITTSDQIG